MIDTNIYNEECASKDCVLFVLLDFRLFTNMHYRQGIFPLLQCPCSKFPKDTVLPFYLKMKNTTRAITTQQNTLSSFKGIPCTYLLICGVGRIQYCVRIQWMHYRHLHSARCCNLTTSHNYQKTQQDRSDLHLSHFSNV